MPFPNFDLLVLLLSTCILPSIFLQWKLQQQQDLQFKAQLQKLWGGQKLRRGSALRCLPQWCNFSLTRGRIWTHCACWMNSRWPCQLSRRALVMSLLCSHSWPQCPIDIHCHIVSCLPLTVVPYATNHRGACKHMRSCVIKLNGIIYEGYHIPPIITPTSLDHAHSL